MDKLLKLRSLFMSDIHEFIKYHNELGLSFIREDREENLINDWEMLKSKLKYPDTDLRFSLNLQMNIDKHYPNEK